MISRGTWTDFGILAIAAGFCSSIASSIVYYQAGANPAVSFFLIIGVALLAFGLAKRFPAAHPSLISPWTRRDVLILAAIILSFAPIFLYHVYSIPWQVNSDEIVITEASARLTSASPVDPWGFGNYFDFPSLSFVVVGEISRMFGGVNFANNRTTNALLGLTSVTLAFVFFRTFLRRWRAIGATIILGVNHSLIAISRMAMREDTALISVLFALIFLSIGYQQKNRAHIFLAGASSALGFYVYAPGRISVIVWSVFGLILILFFRKRMNVRELVRVTAFGIIGFLLVISPLAIATIKAPAGTFDYSRQQILIYPEAQVFQQHWVNAPTIMDGLRINIINGLTSFNNFVNDYGYIYPNYGHGFLDPITGVLLWLGLIAMIVAIIRGRENWLGSSIIVFGFLTSWLVITFLTAKNPDYTRLLVMLPFIASLAIEGIGVIFNAVILLWQKLFKREPRLLHYAIASLTIVSIIGFNAFIFDDFILSGIANGNDFGGTIRYIDARKSNVADTYYLLADAEYPYYSWGDTSAWLSWTKFSAANSQNVSVVSPRQFDPDRINLPFTVFMSSRVWDLDGRSLKLRFPSAVVHFITPDARLIAVEVK